LERRGRDLAYDAFVVLCNAAMRIPVHRVRGLLFNYVAGNEIGQHVALERGVRVTTRGGVSIGDHTNVNRDVTLDGRGTLVVGSLVNISPEVLLLTAEHDPASPSFAGRLRSTSVGDRSWISTRAIVLPGAVIGEGAVVAAGAVVHGVIEPWTIVAGNPACVIGRRPASAQAEVWAPYRRLWH